MNNDDPRLRCVPMEPTITGVEDGTAGLPYYVWEAPGKPIRIQLDFDVIDRMNLDIMRGFGAVPRRGAEVGGILLGSVELGARLLVHIEDFEPVASEHRHGPSWVLSETDKRRLEETLERWGPGPDRRVHVVGFYRSHTRDNLALTDEDLALYSAYFQDPANVILLVRPYATKPSVAGFFFDEEGFMQREESYVEFPFRRRELGGGVASAPPQARPEQPAPRAAYATEEDVAAQPEPLQPADLGSDPTGEPGAAPDDGLDFLNRYDRPAQSRMRGAWIWIPLSSLFLVLGILLGFQAALIGNRPLAARLAGPHLLALTASGSGDAIHVSWDRQSPAIQTAASGTLHIAEGRFNKAVELDPNQLRNGSVIYRSAAPRVAFRLEVYQGRNTVSETFDFRRTDGK